MGGISKNVDKEGFMMLWNECSKLKQGVPTPGDIVKTAGSKNNLAVPFQVAYRALNEDILQQKSLVSRTFS
jgi:hypothetical protein